MNQCPVCSKQIPPEENSELHVNRCLDQSELEELKKAYLERTKIHPIQVVNTSNKTTPSMRQKPPKFIKKKQKKKIKMPQVDIIDLPKVKEVKKDEIKKEVPKIVEIKKIEKNIITKYLCLLCKSYYNIDELFHCSIDCEAKLCKNCLLKEMKFQEIEQGSFKCEFCSLDIKTKDMNQFLYNIN